MSLSFFAVLVLVCNVDRLFIFMPPNQISDYALIFVVLYTAKIGDVKIARKGRGLGLVFK